MYVIQENLSEISKKINGFYHIHFERITLQSVSGMNIRKIQYLSGTYSIIFMMVIIIPDAMVQI